ncbi:YggS family pyridoxal phosphate-dependent enzyme [Candidatus Woesearchaeota archaeon]|nr:YggS family pyridoxal phosphate-dependent enzyme [Candidatus Woesearchaeota archaeon]
MADTIKTNIEIITTELIKISVSKEVVIIAASKTRSVDEIKQAILNGINDVGENYVQEAEAKFVELKRFLADDKSANNGKNTNVKLHLIGHLQSNKAKKAVEIFDVIQTIDSVKIAQIVNDRAEAISKVIEVMIEVNIADEENKHGCKIEEVEGIASEIFKMKNLKLIGLMTMGPVFEECGENEKMEQTEKLRPYFRKMKNKFDEFNNKFAASGFKLKYLSMGMSDSYQVAVEEGSNMVRIGTNIFGSREK